MEQTTAPTAVQRWMVMGMSERCLHNEVCKYGEKRSNGMYCTEEKCKQFKNITKYVEVVRCKDCKHFVQNEPYDPCECMKWTVKWGVANVNPDDFCSYGERKDN